MPPTDIGPARMPRRRFLELGVKGGVVAAATPALLPGALAAAEAGTETARLTADPALLQKVIRQALAQGGDFAEVYLEKRISRTLVMEESKFRRAGYSLSQGAGVRVLSGDQSGYAYSDDLSEASLLRAAEVASFVARGKKITSPVDIAGSALPSHIRVQVPLGIVADARRLEVMARANQAALDYDPRITLVSINYYDEMRGRVIANSEGLLVSDELPLLFFVLQAMASGNGAQHMARERLSRHSGFEMFTEVTPETVARNAAREAVAMLEARDAPAGKMDVVMQNGWGGVLVHEAVGHPLEADNIARGVGAFTGKLGQRVASPVFTMIDDGTRPNARGTTDFDDEGTAMKRNVLIRNGVLEKFMTDVLSARQLGMERTGNGRRESFRFRPIPRMTSTFIAPGPDDPAAILASTPSGLYVQSLSGGSVNPITGIFNFTCREAYLIENGRKTAPVRGATLIGSCQDIISGIDAVGGDLDFGPGICGKGQAAEVDAGQPTVRVRGITVGGTRER